MAKISEGVYFIQGRDDMIPDSHTYIIGEPSSIHPEGRDRPLVY